MYTHCLLCRAPFPPNGRLRAMPRGSCLAYDIEKGRLWQICGSCGRWSLVPLEERWEALEELERLVGSARLLSSTDHVSLYGAGKLRVVRVGSAELAEEAWWRYGEPLARAVAEGKGISRPGRKKGRGTVAWRGERACPGCGHVFKELLFNDRKILVVGASDDPAGPPTLTRRCPRCRDAHQGGLRFTGTEAELILARILAFEDMAGASLDRVRAAARLVQDPGGPETLVRLLARYGHTLGELPPVAVLALEITLVARREARLLRLETEELRFRWRKEEELAALVDGDLTPAPLLGRMIRRVRGRE